MSTSCRILLVEDHHSSREALKQLLSSWGFSVCAVDTLQQAHAALDGQYAVLLDLNLPDGNGAELLNRIRSEGRQIKVAVTSAHPSARDLAEGADLYVEKPITPEKFSLLIEWLRFGRPQ